MHIGHFQFITPTERICGLSIRTEYTFQCLPFSLSSALREFTKTLKPVLAVLRSRGIRVVIYIADMLLLHQQSQVLQETFAQYPLRDLQGFEEPQQPLSEIASGYEAVHTCHFACDRAFAGKILSLQRSRMLFICTI